MSARPSGGPPVSIALVGAGNWGKNLLREFSALPGVRVPWVCDVAEPARRAAASSNPEVRCTADYRLALDDEAVDAVVVATDARSHYAIAHAALEAEKHVFVEKPLALSTRDARALCDLGALRRRTLMVGHIMLYHPAIRALRSMIAEGDLGELRYLYARRLNFRAARSDDSAWWSLAPHDIAVANALFGEAPTAVAATGASVAEPRRDVVFATIDYPMARTAQIHVSWLEPRKTRRLTVVGSRRTAVVDDMAPDRALSLFDTPQGIAPADVEAHERAGGPVVRLAAVDRMEPLRRECEDFVRCVREQRTPIADGASGVAVVRILEAGARSLDAPGRPVAP